MSDRVAALEQALALSPESHPLRLLLVEALVAAGREGEAVAHDEALLAAGALPKEGLLAAGQRALRCGRSDLAASCLDAAEQAGLIDGVAALRQALNRALVGSIRADLARELAEQGVLLPVERGEGGEARPTPRPTVETVSFAQVGGLDEVKKTIHRMIVLPLRRPDLYAKYGRKTGGGVLLYGPPGCGKTMLARATAGECGLPFFNLRIEDVLDPWMGVSERNLHEAFARARAQAPAVLFLDELDAIGFARRKHTGSAARPLVDQLLQELDAIGGENERLLVLAATNAPWDVDDALKRPGRFDRVIFVPPPDAAARAAVLAGLLAERHAEKVDVAALARRTALYSGADLAALVEQAVDRVIEEALDSGQEPPLRQAHLEAALAKLRPTTLEWLARARNYVEFANRDERYADVEAFLKSPEARKYEGG